MLKMHTVPLTVTTGQVMRQLDRLHQGKAAAPEAISPRVLRTCANQLSAILSLNLEKIPMLWKTTCLAPVPKKSIPFGLNDHQPAALISHVIKVVEKLVLAQLLQRDHSHLDRTNILWFPSAFTTIHRCYWGDGWCEDRYIHHLLDYQLPDRPQFVWLSSTLSDMVVSCTGAPQGTALSPILFTLYTWVSTLSPQTELDDHHKGCT